MISVLGRVIENIASATMVNMYFEEKLLSCIVLV